MTFEFSTASRIVFGEGASCGLAAAASEFGERVLLVTGSTARFDDLVKAAAVFRVSSEPAVDTVRQAVARGREHACDVVVAIGGGSSIDTGKAAAAMLSSPGDVLDYLEVIGVGRPLSNPSLPFIAVPTTAGTGSEVTRNAVLGSIEHGAKASLRSLLMYPRLAIVDPALTFDLPPRPTAFTGMDALTQLIEAYVSIRANPLTDAICLDGLRRVAANLERAYDGDRAARAPMSLAATLSGIALSNAGLGAVHGLAAAIGGMFEAPHGAICAILLGPVMEMNLRLGTSRYEDVAQALVGSRDASAAIQWVRRIADRLCIPRLSQWGVGSHHFPTLIERALRSNSMKGNPVSMSPASLGQVINEVL